MAYRWNGVECDTFEELQRLQGVARTTSAVVKETRKPDALTEDEGVGMRRSTAADLERGLNRLLSAHLGPGEEDSYYAPGVTQEDIDRGTHSEFGPK